MIWISFSKLIELLIWTKILEIRANDMTIFKEI
jgi:hypothetical protein